MLMRTTAMSMLALFHIPAAMGQTTAPDHVYASDLITRWGKTVTADNAWRSYPRPQLRRDRWANLNGNWQYAIRPETDPAPTMMDGTILVPFAVESKLSGVGRRVTPSDRLWYKRHFDVPADWRGQRIILHFGAVDYQSVVFVNGAIVGTHRGGSDPFSLDVTDYLKAGGNELTVQVADPTSADNQPRGKQLLKPNTIWYTAVTGIWQTVWLEPVPALHIEDVRMTPDIDQGELHVDVVLNHSASDSDAVRITALSHGKVVASTLLRANRRATLPIAGAHLWSPDDPFLYDLKVQLVKVADPVPATKDAIVSPHGARGRWMLNSTERDFYRDAVALGTPSDTVTGYFAMRKSSIGPGPVAGQPALLLNNKPLFQNGVLDQGWWPDGLLTPPSEDAMRFELGFLKKAGFNMLRKHIKVEPEQYYYEADRLGILIWQDMPAGFDDESLDQLAREQSQEEALMPISAMNEYEAELTRIINALRNHPSIVTWVVNNEGWGQYASTRLGKMVRNLDPSRIVDKASGWLDTGDEGSNIFDIHTYDDVLRVPANHAARAIAIGEYGGVGLPVAGHLWFPERQSWGYQGAADTADFAKRYTTKLDEIIRQARENGLGAAVYTQTTDVEGEVNGLLTYDREVAKIPADQLARIHAPLFQRRE
ncbi:glycoside hydrolase family 2 protein [Sphingomonas sp. PAMC 26605]|uniref:glycoside hydrolase family 2 protein n=1 Tax=Sphingomonas sp. PAMC 26605 TaxID=1112214 RepID=UPI00026CABA5|nr:glycoside hydrolase family 2 [Sphingomonas sp. PAMC 26605]